MPCGIALQTLHYLLDILTGNGFKVKHPCYVVLLACCNYYFVFVFVLLFAFYFVLLVFCCCLLLRLLFGHRFADGPRLFIGVVCLLWFVYLLLFSV